MIDAQRFAGPCTSVFVSAPACVSDGSLQFNYAGCIKSSFPQPSHSAQLMVNTDEYCILTINPRVCQSEEEINAESLREGDDGSWRQMNSAAK